MEQAIYGFTGPRFNVRPFRPQDGERISGVEAYVCPAVNHAPHYADPTADWQAVVRIGDVTLAGFGKGPDEAASGVRQMLLQALNDLHAGTSRAVARCCDHR